MSERSIRGIKFRQSDVDLINILLKTPYKDDRDAYRSEDSKDFIVHIMTHVSGVFLKTGQTLYNRSYRFRDVSLKSANNPHGCMHETCLLAYFAYLCVKHLSIMNAEYRPIGAMYNYNPEDEELIDTIEAVASYIYGVASDSNLVYNYANKYLPLLGGWCEPFDWVEDYGQHPMTVEMNPEIDWEEFEEDE